MNTQQFGELISSIQGIEHGLESVATAIVIAAFVRAFLQ